MILGVPRPARWRSSCSSAGFVPYLGSIFTSAVIVLLAALASGGAGTALILAVLIVAEWSSTAGSSALQWTRTGAAACTRRPADRRSPDGAALGGILGMFVAVPTVAVVGRARRYRRRGR